MKIDSEFWSHSDHLSFFRSRRSVRRFIARPVPDGVLTRVLEAAIWAPSAHNRQPWRFAVLRTFEAKKRLAEEMGSDFERDLFEDGMPAEEVKERVKRSYQRITAAPVVIIVFLCATEMDSYPDTARQNSEHLMGVQSVAMAGENLLLAANAEGLGAVWMCAPLFAPQAVLRAISLPEAWLPQGIVLLGYPESIPGPRERRVLDEVVRYF